MSSTNRGYERHKTDYYVTPKGAVRDFLDAFLGDLQNNEIFDALHLSERPDKILWLDPCAGGDAKHEMTYPTVIQGAFGCNVDTMDIREDSLADDKVDYLTTPLRYKPQVIISNPPFYLAKEFITKALNDVDRGGYVIMLLRLNFFGSKDRKKFFEENMPIVAYVHHRRFSFTDDKKTDSIEYMHAVWQKGTDPKFAKLRII